MSEAACTASGTLDAGSSAAWGGLDTSFCSRLRS
jgi:hypothetical protein